MKRRFCFILLIIMSTLLFSNSFFRERYFELKVDIPMNVSTNTLKIMDFLKKEVEIDLTELANNVPNNGFDLYLNAAPNYKMTLNINEKFKFGPRIGTELFGLVNVSKSLFDFIGIGNQYTDTYNFTTQVNADVFAYLGFLVGIKIGKFRMGVTPNMFAPICSVSTENLFLCLENTSNGGINIVGQGKMGIYTNFDIENAETDLIFNSLKNGIGFDIEGYFGVDFNKYISLDLNYKVPIKFGLLEKSISYDMDINFNTTLAGMLGGDFEEDFKLENKHVNDYSYKIYRPMKFNLALKFSPFENFLTINALAGIGFYHPFMSDTKIFPEYCVSAKLSFIGLFTFQVSTSYLDRCFSHNVVGGINLRLIQIEAGLGLSSTDFIKSFQITGINGFVSFAIGF